MSILYINLQMPGALPGVTGPAVLLLVVLELDLETEHVMQVIAIIQGDILKLEEYILKF